MGRRTGGFTLIELLIVVAIIAIVMAIVVPGLLRARIAANETAAIGALKTTVTAQEQFKSNAVVDTDGDGQGEYGYFTELSGVENYRTRNCTYSDRVVTPAFLTGTLGTSVQSVPAAPRYAAKSGYCFRIFLPQEDGQALGLPEDIPPPCNVLAANNQETRWVAYAWPASMRVSGNRAFFTNPEGEVYQTYNVVGQQYDGDTFMPDALGGNEALAPGSVNLDGSPPGYGQPSNDGFPWNPVGN